MVRRAFVPTEAQRRQVKAMAAYGVPQDSIALVLDIDPTTLRKRFRIELSTGAAEANARVAESLYRKAVGDGPQSVTAAIFWCKARLGWTERAALEVTRRYAELSDDELAAEIAALQGRHAR